MEAFERIICALDVDNAEGALALVEKLQGHVGLFKVGLQLLMAEGPQVVSRLLDAGACRIFLDAKLHDISNTVAGAMRGVVRQGAWCVTVHASGGGAMLRAAVRTARETAEAENRERPRILGVTLLTSLGAETLHDEMQVDRAVPEYVANLACLARQSGCDGVIVAPPEIEVVRRAVPDPDFLVITPGVRPAGAAVGDQARVMTPAEAVRRGADYLVIGRPITAAPDPVAAANAIAAEIAAAV